MDIYDDTMIRAMAIEHLKRLTANDPTTQGYTGDVYCPLCGQEPHDPDCPWVAARDFLAQLSNPTSSDARRR